MADDMGKNIWSIFWEKLANKEMQGMLKERMRGDMDWEQKRRKWEERDHWNAQREAELARQNRHNRSRYADIAKRQGGWNRARRRPMGWDARLHKSSHTPGGQRYANMANGSSMGRVGSPISRGRSAGGSYRSEFSKPMTYLTGEAGRKKTRISTGK